MARGQRAVVRDLSPAEVALRTTVDPADWVARLTGEMRVVGLTIPTARGSDFRWVAAEYAPEYAAAFGLGGAPSLDVEEAIEEARRQFDGITHYVLLSGDCYPTKSRGFVDRYLDDDRDVIEAWLPSVAQVSPPSWKLG